MSNNSNTAVEKRTVKNRYARKREIRKKLVIIIVSVIVVIGVAVGIIGKKLYDDYQAKVSAVIDTDNFYNGIYIQDIDMSGKTKEQAVETLKLLESSLRDNVNIRISLNGEELSLTTDNVSFTFNTENAVEEAYSVGRQGSRDERYKKVLSLTEAPEQFYIEHSIPAENEGIAAFIQELAQQAHVDMQPPYISAFNPGAANPFVSHDGVNGVDLDTGKLKTDIMNALQSKKFSEQIAANLLVTPFTGSFDDLASQTVLLSQFSTVSTNNSNGNHNMALALSSVNGSIIRPGKSFSFNGTTGNSTLASNGYLPAGAIAADGSFTDELGGGICQAATTVYGAALRADMTITARSNHMYPSTYVTIGQDATVDYPYTDFCFRNDSSYSVFIEASMLGNTLSVKLYGYHPAEWDSIEVTSQSTGTSGQYITAEGQKIFYKDGEVIKSESISSSAYKPKKD